LMRGLSSLLVVYAVEPQNVPDVPAYPGRCEEINKTTDLAIFR